MDQVERAVGGGIEMGNTCKPMAVSFQCMTKSTTIKKIIIIKKSYMNLFKWLLIYVYTYIYIHTHTCSQLQLWLPKPWWSRRCPRHSTGQQTLMLVISHDHYHYWSMGVVLQSQWLSDLDLNLPISCPHVSLDSFLLELNRSIFFLTLSESLREANAHSLKCFHLKIFLFCFYS